jgi:hypothetical protein
MARRREFLQAGLAVSALPLLTQSGLRRSDIAWGGESTVAARAEALLTLRVQKVIVDTDLSESRVFAREAARFGLATSSFTGGDATSLWYHELDPIWRERPCTIAGLTRFGPLFVLERLAWDRGMRVLYRAEHKQNSGAESFYSWAIGPRERA